MAVISSSPGDRGSARELAANSQTVIVFVVLRILVIFAVVTLANMNTSLLAPSGRPLRRQKLAIVGLAWLSRTVSGCTAAAGPVRCSRGAAAVWAA